ncbi:MAG: sugar phosphate isomerase/epimerase [Chloroflexi bacterium]|nr:sugar phosphate isomerase/epimerase [Chloroflexota bacterium]
MPTHFPIGFMLWRIGPIVDLEEQLAWTQQYAFDAIGLHAHPGQPGEWQGLDPATTDAATRQRWRELLAPYARREVHAPMPAPAEVTLDNPQAAVPVLVPAIKLAGDIGAEVVTVHARTPPKDEPAPADWLQALIDLDNAAGEAGVSIGLELREDFEWLDRLPLAHTGLTLDVGHMYHRDSAPIRPYGSLGNLVRAVHRHLVHIHVHDINPAGLDHIECGTGIIPYEELMSALAEVGYQGMLCMELNPNRTQPEGIPRSWERLLRAMGES